MNRRTVWDSTATGSRPHQGLDQERWQLVLDSSGELDKTQAVAVELPVPAQALVVLRRGTS